MPGVVSVGALAIADGGANAVGAVRFVCAPDGLEIELVRAATFAFGFAPAAVAEEVRFKVSYVAVRALVRKGRTLHVALDPRVASPFNRFALVGFTEDPREALLGAYAARMRARLASIVVPLPLGASVAAALAPSTLVSGPLGAGAVALVVAGATWLLLRELAAWRTWGGPLSDRYRDALEGELSRRLGLAPAVVASSPPPAAVPVPSPLGEAGPDPRWRAGIAIALAALGAIGVMAFLKRFGGPEEGRPARAAPSVPTLTARATPAARSAAALAVKPASEVSRCVCQRADSPLWQGGMPSLTLLPSPRRGAIEVAPRLDAKGTARWDFDLAVVNNTSSPQADIRVVVTFARRDAANERVDIRERGLFFEGELGSGRAVKWRVRAPGTEMKVEADTRGKLGVSGIEPASADAFFELARSARYRVVRVHAAVMLAYLRDPRARDVADAVGFSEADEVTLARVRRASRELFVCDVAPTRGSPASWSACVFNGSTVGYERGTLREIAADGTEGRSWPVDVPLPIHEGVRVTLPLEGKVPSEVVVGAGAD